MNGLRVLSYGLPECIEKVVERIEVAVERKGKTAARARPGNCVQPLRERRGEFHHSLGHAALDGEHQDGSRWRRGGLHGRVGNRAGLGHDDGADCRRSAGLPMARVKVMAADTDLTPIDLGSYSSRVTFMNGQCDAARGAGCGKTN